MEPLPVASRASSLVPTPWHTPGGFTYQTPTGQEPGLPTPGQPSTIRPPIALDIGAGILTSFPSAMAFALTLGADSPYADERCVGNLALTASGLFTRFNATHVSIRTSDTSSIPCETPSQAYRTLPYPVLKEYSPSFGAWLSPVTSSAQDDSISELLRFL